MFWMIVLLLQCWELTNFERWVGHGRKRRRSRLQLRKWLLYWSLQGLHPHQPDLRLIRLFSQHNCCIYWNFHLLASSDNCCVIPNCLILTALNLVFRMFLCFIQLYLCKKRGWGNTEFCYDALLVFPSGFHYLTVNLAHYFPIWN